MSSGSYINIKIYVIVIYYIIYKQRNVVLNVPGNIEESTKAVSLQLLHRLITSTVWHCIYSFLKKPQNF